MEIRLVSSLEKAGIGPEPGKLEDTHLFVFPGDTVSVQIAFRCGEQDGWQENNIIDGESRWLKVQARAARCGDAPGEGAADGAGSEALDGEWTDALGIRIRNVLPVMCRKSCNPDSHDEDYLFYDARKAPDLLRELEPEGKVPVTGEWQSLWVDFCPEDIRAKGRYQVDFVLQEEPGKSVCQDSHNSGSSGAESRVSVTVEVPGRELPKLGIPHTEWFHCDGIVNYYGVEAFSEEFWRILRNFLDVYVRRGGNTILTPIITPPLDTEVGGERTTIQLVDVELAEDGYRLGFGKMERFLDVCLDAGIVYFEMCHLFTQWGAAAAPKVMAMADGEEKRIFGWDTPSNDPEYLRFLSALLPGVKELLERRGLLKNSFFHISDEPDLNAEHYPVAHGTVRRLLEGCTIIEAVSDYKYWELGLVDIPVCAIDHIKPFLEKRPPRLWAYYCCAQTTQVPNRFISMPSWRNRIYGTLLYWHQIDGILHWGFNFYNSMYSKKKIDPYETVDADEGFPAGDAFLVYPGKDGIPEESIRLMVFEEGLSDYRALCLLESFVGREKVTELIRREAGMELSFFQYPKSAEFILRLRRKVDALLASHTGQ